MYPKLVDTVHLRRERNGYLLFQASRFSRATSCVYLSGREAQVLGLMSGDQSEQGIVAMIGEANGARTESTEAEYVQIARRHARYIEMHETLAETPREVPLLEYASSEDRRLHGSDGHYENRLSAPVRLNLMVTARCNCSCLYCCNKAILGDPHNVAAEDYLRVLREAKECGCINIVFTGGEPTLYPELPRLIGLCSDLGLCAELSSRAQTDMVVWDALLANGLRNVQVSLDSADETVVDRLSGAGVFHRTMTLLAYLLRQDVDLVVNCVLTRPTIGGVASLVARLLAMGVPSIRLTPFLQPLGHADMDELSVTPEQQDRFNELVASQPREWGAAVATFRYSHEMRHRIAADGKAEQGVAKLACASGASEMLISYNGDAIYCDRVMSVPAMVYGNIQESSLLELWQSERLRRLRLPAQSLHKNSVCGECPYFEPCVRKGKCYYYALRNHSTLYAPDFLCDRVRHREKPQGIS